MYFIQVNSFADWRKQARELLKRCVSPERVVWQHEKQCSLLWGDDEDSFLSLAIQCQELTIPSQFFDLAKNVACYRDENRWSLLYSVAWRLIFDERNLLDLKIDEQISRLLDMQKSVSRDRHKMKAFVRFCLVNNVAECEVDDCAKSTKQNTVTDTEYFVAWFEPEHLIVSSIAPFFVKRFNNMRWSILTPDLCAHWDLSELSFSAGIKRPLKVEDNLEALWREYYANIFNPARLKLKAMQSEMPKKYWVNLPEAPLIAELTRSAGRQLDTMINEKPSMAWSKTAKSHYVKAKQRELRSLKNKTSL